MEVYQRRLEEEVIEEGQRRIVNGGELEDREGVWEMLGRDYWQLTKIYLNSRDNHGDGVMSHFKV